MGVLDWVIRVDGFDLENIGNNEDFKNEVDDDVDDFGNNFKPFWSNKVDNFTGFIC